MPIDMITFQDLNDTPGCYTMLPADRLIACKQLAVDEIGNHQYCQYMHFLYPENVARPDAFTAPSQVKKQLQSTPDYGSGSGFFTDRYTRRLWSRYADPGLLLLHFRRQDGEDISYFSPGRIDSKSGKLHFRLLPVLGYFALPVYHAEGESLDVDTP